MIPGATLYISQWFPQSKRGRAISGTVTRHCRDDRRPALGCAARAPGAGSASSRWQWMFIEAAPTILLGAFHRPHPQRRSNRADWLDERERADLISTLAQRTAQRRHGANVTGAAAVPRIGASGCCSLPISASAPNSSSMVLWWPADHCVSAKSAALRIGTDQRDPLSHQRRAHVLRRPAFSDRTRHALALCHRRADDRRRRPRRQRLSHRQPGALAHRADRRHQRGRPVLVLRSLASCRAVRRRSALACSPAAARSAASLRRICWACSASTTEVSRPGSISWRASR